jgi:hypothetical protein
MTEENEQHPYLAVPKNEPPHHFGVDCVAQCVKVVLASDYDTLVTRVAAQDEMLRKAVALFCGYASDDRTHREWLNDVTAFVNATKQPTADGTTARDGQS